MPGHKYKGSNINLVKLHNMQIILLILLHDRNISRVQLAQKTRLSNSTISNLIGELIQLGIVSEKNQENGNSAELRPVGRPSSTISLEPNARYSVGMHIGVGMFRVCVVNLVNEMISSEITHFDVEEPVKQVMDKMIAAINGIIASSGIDRNLFVGVGVGASGLVDFQTGINLLAPNLNWHNVPIRDYLQKGLNLPVIVENNARTMAINEKYFGAAKDVNTLVFVYGRIGVGAGLVFKGDLFNGNTTGAGEIGHTVMLLEGGESCRCGNTGCLETLVSEPAIIRQAEKIAHSNPDGILAKINQQHPELTVIERVFLSAREGDEEVKRLLEKRGYYLGVAIAGLVNLFNPEMIIFGGIFAQGQDLFLKTVTETVHQKSFGGLGKKVHMQATSFGWRAAVLGAAALGLIYFFYQQSESLS